MSPVDHSIEVSAAGEHRGSDRAAQCSEVIAYVPQSERPGCTRLQSQHEAARASVPSEVDLSEAGFSSKRPRRNRQPPIVGVHEQESVATGLSGTYFEHSS